MKNKVDAKLYWDSYPNAPVERWSAEFSDRSRAMEYIRMLRLEYNGVNVNKDADGTIDVSVFA